MTMNRSGVLDKYATKARATKPRRSNAAIPARPITRSARRPGRVDRPGRPDIITSSIISLAITGRECIPDRPTARRRRIYRLAGLRCLVIKEGTGMATTPPKNTPHYRPPPSGERGRGFVSPLGGQTRAFDGADRSKEQERRNRAQSPIPPEMKSPRPRDR
jgi:hypothetical protein